MTDYSNEVVNELRFRCERLSFKSDADSDINGKLMERAIAEIERLLRGDFTEAERENMRTFEAIEDENEA